MLDCDHIHAECEPGRISGLGLSGSCAVEQQADPSKPEALYLHIRRYIEDHISAGNFAPGCPIPSEHELSLAFSTTRLTVRSAIDDLVERGVLRRVQGKGTFVSQGFAGPIPHVNGFRADIRAGKGVPTVRQLSKTIRKAGPLYSDLFGIESDDGLFSIRRLNYVDGIPYSLEQTLVPVCFFPCIASVDVSVFSLYETYEMCGRPVLLAQEKLDVAVLSARDAGLLQAEPGQLALSLECVSFDGEGLPIEHAYALMPEKAGEYIYRY